MELTILSCSSPQDVSVSTYFLIYVQQKSFDDAYNEDRLFLGVRKPALLVENSTFDSLTVGTRYCYSRCIESHEAAWRRCLLP
jgi:hypothetical protein